MCLNTYRLKSVEIIVEDAVSPIGSCCDDGRFVFADCGNWWYNCPFYGIQNYTKWLRFGPNAYTLPTGTEHRAKCSYYSSKITCPLPASCDLRRALPGRAKEICKEMPQIVKIP